MNKTYLVIVLSVFLLSGIGMAADVVTFHNTTSNTITTMRPYDNVTVRVTNSAANKEAGVREAGTVRIYSAQDLTGIIITVTETEYNNGIFEGQFRPHETASDNVADLLYVLNSSNITATADLDGDGGYGNGTAQMVSDPPKIETFTNNAYNDNSTYFEHGSNIYLQIASITGLTSPQAVIMNNQSTDLAVTVTESVTNLYRAIVNTTAFGAGGLQINISSDLKNNGQNSSLIIYVKDGISVFSDDYENEETYFSSGDKIYIKIGNSLHNTDTGARETGTVNVNSSVASLTVTVTETGVNTGIFTGNFTINTSDSSGQLKVGGNDKITIRSDLDSNDAIDATKDVWSDNTVPSLLWVRPVTEYNKSASDRTVRINITDNFLMNSSIHFWYWRPFQAEDYDQDGERDNGEGAYLKLNSGGGNKTKYFEAVFSDVGLITGYNVSYWFDAYDYAGNKANGGNWSHPYHTYTIDNTAPFNVNILNLDEGQLIGDEIYLNVTWNDTDSGININTAEYFIKNPSSVIVRNGVLTNCETNKCYFGPINVTNLTNDNLVITFYIEDNVRNSITDSVTVMHSSSDGVVNESIRLELIENVSVAQKGDFEITVTVKNNGIMPLNNIRFSVNGFEYESYVFDDVLSGGDSKTYIIGLNTGEAVVGKKDGAVTVTASSNIGNNVSFSRDFSINVLPGVETQNDLKSKHIRYISELDILKNDIEYLRDRMDVTSIETVANRIVNNLNSMQSSIEDDFILAGKIAPEIENDLNNLRNVINTMKANLPADYTLIIVIVIIIIAVVVLVFLLWPVEEGFEVYE